MAGGWGLAGGVAPEHGVGHELEHVDAELLVVLLAVDVAEEVAGGGEEIVEALALGGVFFGGERAAIALDEAGDTAVGGLDLVA